MQVALLQQLLFDAGFNAFAKQGAVRQHQRGTALVFKQVLDEHQKQVGRLFGAHVGGKVVFGAGLFHAAKRRVGDDDVHTVGGAIVAQRAGEGVVMGDLAGHFYAMQHHVGGAQHVGQLLFLHAPHAALQGGLVLLVLDLFAQVLQGADQKAAGAAGWV